MSTLPPLRSGVKVVAHFPGKNRRGKPRRRVLVEEPLTLENLAFLQPQSPLSRMVLDGAGLPYSPSRITVYVNGKKAWSKECRAKRRTDWRNPSRKREIQAVTFTDAYGPGYASDDERLADNRAAWEHLRNTTSDRYDLAEEIAADLIESAGSLRPKMRPTKPQPDKPRPIRPEPTPVPVPVRVGNPPKYEDQMWTTRYAAREFDEWVTAQEGFWQAEEERSLEELLALFD